MRAKKFSPFILSLGGMALVTAGLLIYGFVRITSLETKVASLSADIASTTTALVGVTDNLTHTLSAAEQNIEETKSNISSVKSQVGGVEQTVGTISGTVSTLQKLSKTDPELLQKYKKVFFLNEHYTPERVVEISKEYLYSEDRPEVIHELIWPKLRALIDAAKGDNVIIYVRSAYRSFDEQRALKDQYTVVYGAGTANQFSADQGYSEHQLGTTADFITTGLSGQLGGFDTTPAYPWLLANAYKYGFILSYPRNNTHYIFEPWHWRFVGIQLATYLHNQNLSFYDLDQRTIDTFLANIFD